jgi:hypothetical protein
MHRLPANQKRRPHRERWQQYEKPRPGHQLQLDVKFLERIPLAPASAYISSPPLTTARVFAR